MHIKKGMCIHVGMTGMIFMPTIFCNVVILLLSFTTNLLFKIM